MHPLCPPLPAALTGASAQITPNANDFNFFPAGAHQNCTVGDCAFPGAWWQKNQTEYEILGNTDGKGLLKIAVSDYYPEGPTLYVIPGAWCDRPGAIANAESNGLRPRNSRRHLLRRLAAAITDAAMTTPKKQGPPAVTVNSGATCGLTGEEPVSYKVGDGVAQVAERVRGGAFKIALPNNLADVSLRGLDGIWLWLMVGASVGGVLEGLVSA